MKEGWKYVKLGDIASVVHGKNQKAVESEEGQYPIYGSGGSIMGYATEYLCDEGTTILGRKGTINNPLFIETKFWNVDTAFGISAKSTCNKKFLYYFVKSQDWSKKNSGTTLPSLTQSVVLDTQMPFCDISEQKQIVDFLDAEFAKIDELKKQAEQSLQNAKDLFQAALKEMLTPKEGWAKKTLKECTTSIGDGLHGTPKYVSESSYYFVNGNNLENGSIVIKSDTKRVSVEEYIKYKIELDSTTVLLSINGTIGKTAFFNGETIILGKSACYMNVCPDLRKEFLRYYLQSDYFFEYANQNSRQATIKNLGLKEIRAMMIPLPSLDEQKRIIEILDDLSQKTNALQSNYTRTIQLCADLKQALLRQVFE